MQLPRRVFQTILPPYTLRFAFFSLLIAVSIIATVVLVNQNQSVTRFAATSIPSCWPNAGPDFAGTLAGQPNAIWCYTDYSDGPSTAVKGSNTWVDDFNHGLAFGKMDTTNYTDFPMIGSGYKSQLFRHGNHWMRDVSGVSQDPCSSVTCGPWDFMASMMRPNTTFQAENGKLVIEADVATRVSSYGGNLFWPEFVITTADHPGAPFRDGAPQWQSDIRNSGTYVYEAFPGSWTLGCRLQNDGGFTCALLDDGFGGDTPSRVFELSHFQCGNNEGGAHPGSVYGCNEKYGGLPTNLPAADASYSRNCAELDPDVNCRDRWRWEITNNRLTWFANGKRYMEHWDFEPEAQAALDQLLTKPVYVYFGEFIYKLGKPARMHWDRIAINPKDASGNLQPPSASETFCFGAPNNTCGATGTTATVTPTSGVGATKTPTVTPTKSISPTTTLTPIPTLTTTPSVTPPAGTQLINFDSLSPVNRVLSGQSPSGVINWGTNQWFLSGPWQKFTTNSVSFTSSRKNSTFTFVSPKQLVSFDAFNGSGTTTTLTITCNGGQRKSFNLPGNTVTKVNTGWSQSCQTVNMATGNGWNTNFDNLIIK